MLSLGILVNQVLTKSWTLDKGKETFGHERGQKANPFHTRSHVFAIMHGLGFHCSHMYWPSSPIQPLTFKHLQKQVWERRRQGEQRYTYFYSANTLSFRTTQLKIVNQYDAIKNHQGCLIHRQIWTSGRTNCDTYIEASTHRVCFTISSQIKAPC